MVYSQNSNVNSRAGNRVLLLTWNTTRINNGNKPIFDILKTEEGSEYMNPYNLTFSEPGMPTWTWNWLVLSTVILMFSTFEILKSITLITSNWLIIHLNQWQLSQLMQEIPPIWWWIKRHPKCAIVCLKSMSFGIISIMDITDLQSIITVFNIDWIANNHSSPTENYYYNYTT